MWIGFYGYKVYIIVAVELILGHRGCDWMTTFEDFSMNVFYYPPKENLEILFVKMPWDMTQNVALMGRGLRLGYPNSHN